MTGNTAPKLLSIEALQERVATEDATFSAWRNSVPDSHWTKRDLTALRIGYELGKSMMATRDGDSALWTLRMILHDLPQNKDWLDPEVEKVARELVKRHPYADLSTPTAALAPPSGEGVEDYYVAWMRYSGQSIVVCDSDAPRAFKVYRHPAPQSAPVDANSPQYEAGFKDGLAFEAEHRLFTPPPASQERGGDSLRELLIDCQLAIESIPRDSSAKGDLVNRLTTVDAVDDPNGECPTCHQSLHVEQAQARESREARMVVVERDESGKPTVWCDPEIVDLVTALNAAGIRTVASCSGHSEQHGNIALADGRELIIAPSFESARKIEAQAGEGSCGPATSLSDETLVEVALQTAGRSAMYDNEIQHNRYHECRTELLRRLAGGVTVDDVMVIRACNAYFDNLPTSGGDAANPDAMRAALVAALENGRG